jgi:subtilisin family serine protease
MNKPTRNDAKLLHHVTNEVCVVLEVPEEAQGDAGSQAVYDEVLRTLNQEIGEAVDRLRKVRPSLMRQTLGEDLGLHLLDRETIRDDLQLSPLVRGQESGGGGSSGYGEAYGQRSEGIQSVLSPAVHFPTTCGRSKLLHFYQVGPPLKLDGPQKQAMREMQDRAPLVRALVSLINAVLRGHPVRTAAGMLTVSAASPNWLSGGSNGGLHISGGPGTSPLPVPPGTSVTGQFQSAEAGVRTLLDDPKGGENIVVAVLDTCPSAQGVRAAATRFSNNTLLNWVADNVHIDPPGLSIPLDQLPPPDLIKVNWGGVDENDQDRYIMADHGLFVAGIIHSIAPMADIYLIRVLNDMGVGDLVALANVVQQLTSLLEGKPAGTRLVVNMSLMVDIPTGAQALQFWAQQTSNNLDDLVSSFESLSAVIDASQASIQTMIDWAAQQGALLVSAAGNDGQGEVDADHPDPRWPARSAAVLAVASVNRAQEPATFSNAADMMTTATNGIAAYGGNAQMPPPANEAPQIEVDGNQPDAIVGIFSADTLPFAAGSNQTGWVYWAGTSFSTPIIAGLAANVWSQTANSALAASEVIVHLTSLTGMQPEAHLRCPAIVVTQS